MEKHHFISTYFRDSEAWYPFNQHPEKDQMANHSSYHNINKYNHIIARDHPMYKLRERRISIQNICWSIHWSSLRENWEQKCHPCLTLFMCCLWHDNMLMGTTSINQLLSCISTKHKLSYHLAHVLEHFEGNAVNVVVVCDTDYQPTEAHKKTLSRGGWCSHSSACPSEHSRERLTGGACLISWQTQTS